MYLAAPTTGGQILGSIGTGGLGLLLLLVFILGTREQSRHKLSQHQSLTVCLIAGVVWMAAGKIWGLPDDLLTKVIMATQNQDALGDVGLGAVSLALVLVAYLVTMRPRMSGYLGLTMASSFTLAGGMWGTAAGTIGDVAASWA